MKTNSGRAAVPVAGALLATDANPAVWALALRWGSRIDGEGDPYVAAALLVGHGPQTTGQNEPLGEAA